MDILYDEVGTIEYEDVVQTLQEDEVSVSSNQNNDEILQELRLLNERSVSINDLLERIYIQTRDRSESVNYVPVYVSDNQTEHITVSQDNIMTKLVNDYTVQESLLLFIGLSLFVTILIKIIGKGLRR